MSTGPSSAAPQGSLLARHDTLLLDLDGVVYAGGTAVPGAVGVLQRAAAAQVRLAFVTNNASRTPDAVAQQLVDLGVAAGADDVVTSAEVAAQRLARLLPPGARTLVVGGPGLAQAVERRGLLVVRRADEQPLAVVQGFGPDVGWRELAEASYAVAAGVPWIATNTDRTVPTGRGLAPGNGTLVEAVATATGRRPDLVVGKPQPTLFQEAASRSSARSPLVVGDRLDTDIVGARLAGLPSLLVLTGVTDVQALLVAPEAQRPDHLGLDLSALLEAPPSVDLDGARGEARAGGWQVRVEDGRVVVTGSGSANVLLACLAAVVWPALDEGRELDLTDVVVLVGRLERSAR